MKRILIIQTAFLGDVVLATVLIEKLRDLYPKSKIDFLLRKGNESLLQYNSKVDKVLVWNKKRWKYYHLFKIILDVRKSQYDLTINLQRFASSGLLSYFSGSKVKVGFDKNPFSFCFHYKIKHEIGNGLHEIERNLNTLDFLGGHRDYKPKIYYSLDEKIRREDTIIDAEPYVVMAPASVWYTKQFPMERWVELVNKIPDSHFIFLIGSPADYDLCRSIQVKCNRENLKVLAHKFSILESAVLMKQGAMNFVNDSVLVVYAARPVA